MSNVKTKKIIVKKRDNLWNIVKENGFPPKDWKKIYNASYNSKLKKLRPDPNIILPGDEVYLPVADQKEIARRLVTIKKVSKKVTALAKIVSEGKKTTKDLERLAKKSGKFDDILIKRLEKFQKKSYEMALDILDEMATETDPYAFAGMAAYLDKLTRLQGEATRAIMKITKSKDRLTRNFEKEMNILKNSQTKAAEYLARAISDLNKTTADHISSMNNSY